MELEDLRSNPLPPDESDLSIPTRIAQLDEHKKFLESQISALQDSISQSNIEREELLKRSRELRISEDKNYKIVDIPIYPKKRVDISALKKFEDKYKLILTNIAERIKDKAAADALKADTYISQADVKAVIRDKAVLAQVIPEPTEPDHWEVSLVRK